jgi:hypothetical protein
MNTHLRFAIILSLVVLGNVFHASTSVATETASTTNSSVGVYVCDDIEIHLAIKPDGTYEALFKKPPISRHESGVWEAKGGDIILQRRSGGTGFSIHQLRPDLEIPGSMLWISPSVGSGGGVIAYPLFHREGQ